MIKFKDGSRGFFGSRLHRFPGAKRSRNDVDLVGSTDSESFPVPEKNTEPIGVLFGIEIEIVDHRKIAWTDFYETLVLYRKNNTDHRIQTSLLNQYKRF